jgi:hypothetical protein
MIDLIKIVDGTARAYSFEQLKRDNPKTGFGASPHNVDLAAHGVAIVRNVLPSHDPMMQDIDKGSPKLVGGKWVNEWLVTDKPIETIRENSITAMTARIDQFTAQFTANMPRDEVLSWPTKAAGAQIVLNGGESAIISAEAEILGVDATTVATLIAGRADTFAAVIGAVTGVRRSAETEIRQAVSRVEVRTALDYALGRAKSVAKTMGLEF